jgi:hypothetical protein
MEQVNLTIDIGSRSLSGEVYLADGTSIDRMALHEAASSFQNAQNEKIRDMLEEKFGQNPPFALLAVGSDARREKTSIQSINNSPPSASGKTPVSLMREKNTFSPLEAILLYDGSRRPITPTITDWMKNNKEVVNHLEIKDLSRSFSPSGKALHFKSDAGKDITIPARAVDASFIFGNQDILEKYKKTAFKDILEMKTKTQKCWQTTFIKPELEKLKNSLERTCVDSIDISSGKLVYDNERIRSTKYTLLRAVQYWLVDYLISAIKNEVISEEKYKELPASESDRMLWLSKERLWNLSEEEAGHFAKAYDQALIWYLESQEAFTKEKSSILVNPDLLQETAKTLFELVSKTPQDLLPNKK